jgi:hypothetical protein
LIDLHEGAYPAAREKSQHALAMFQQIGDLPTRPPRGTTWPRST